MLLNIRLRQLTNGTRFKKQACDEHHKIQQMQWNFLNIIRRVQFILLKFWVNEGKFLKLYGKNWPKFEQVQNKVPTPRTLEFLPFDE